MVGRTNTEDVTNLHLPRILCLHGGGTNARIFRAQCRVLEAQLRTNFRLCYAEAPFPSNAGPDVLSVYKDWGPFKRWLRWLPGHPEIDAQTAIEEIERSLYAAMDEDDLKGATGEWVGLLGFSQGAKMCASLLFRQQMQMATVTRNDSPWPQWRFAVLLAGRAPLVSLDPMLMGTGLHLADPSQISTYMPISFYTGPENTLKLPTIHVHGLQDPGLQLHRQLLDICCDPESTRLIEWDGNHRVPIKTKDVTAVVQAIVDLGIETGCFDV